MSATLPPEDQEARTQRHFAILDTLIAQGTDLANRLHQQATTPKPPEPGPPPPEPQTPQPNPPVTPETIALFDQISRAIRRTILVSRKLAEPLPLAPIKPSPGHLTADRKRIIREVEDTIHQKAAPAEAETLQAELHERVESVDLDDDIGRRPLHMIIEEICRDLGIVSTWDQARYKRRTPQDLKTLSARALQPSSPAKPEPRDPEPGITALNGFNKPELRPPKH